jgi:diacylglycerol O-acyltransferase / wax synthase
MPDRLSALDRSFLTAETPAAPMHVGWAAVFDPPPRGARPGFKELRAYIADRLDRAPRYRQRLAPVPLGLHTPRWVDDQSFDIDRHVRHAPTPDLDEAVATAMSAPLDRDHPLWECWIVEGLAGDRVGVVGKVHHCLADGLAAVELASVLVDPTPQPPPSEGAEWRPAPVPAAPLRLAEGIADRVRDELALLGTPARLLASPARIPGAVAAAKRSTAAVAHSLWPPAPGSQVLNHPISPRRHLARVARPLDDLLRIKTRFGTKLNDVVLAVCAGGVRGFLGEHGERPVRLKAMVPVSVRGEGDELGNRISFMFIGLPCEEPHPVQRLRHIHAVTAARKRSGEPSGADTVLNVIGLAPTLLQRAFTRLVASPRTFNLVVSNIPGPRAPLWMRGCELREAYPVVPLADQHALSIGFTTVRDGAYFGLYADRESLPDVDALGRHVDAATDELLGLATRSRGRRGARRASRRSPVAQPSALIS